MISIYRAETTDFSHAGVGILSDIINPQVVEELNGQFYMEFQYLPNGNNYKALQVDRIVKADASPRLPNQLFRIVRMNRVGKNLTTVYAEHVSNHTRQLQLKEDFVFSGSATGALKKWAETIVVEHPFTTNSDVKKTGVVNLPFVDIDNARDALGGVDNSILAAFGGEYRFDNYRISLLERRGWDRGTSIRYGKNLIDIDQEDEIATVATTLLPYASYTPKRELVDKKNPDKDKSEKIPDPKEIFVTLPEKIIDCENVERFARRNIAKKDFNSELGEFFNELNEKYDYSDNKVIKEKLTKKLREVAIQYMKNHSFGIPNVNLRIEYVDLAKTIDYQGRASAEDIGLGDWVSVEFDRIGVSRKAQVTVSRYDPQNKRYLNLDIGEMRMNLTQKINHEIIDLTGKYEGLDKEITTVRDSADGKNKIFRGVIEPTGNLKNGDLWYKPVGDGEVELYMYQDGEWEALIHSGLNQEVEQALELAEQKIQDAREHTEAVEKDAQTILAGLGVPSVGEIHQELADSIDANVGVRINRVTETTSLYERVIGSSESGIKNNVARIVMADNIFRTDVSNTISGLSTSVTQLEGSWALRINSNDDLVTAINASERGVHIKGKDITFDGQVYSKGDFTVTGEMISDTIRANKIYGGVLNAANIRVINLDADSISSGSLSGVEIFGGANKGFHVPVDADGIYNRFAPDEHSSEAARWKRDDHNYIYQDDTAVRFYIGTSQRYESDFAFFKESDGHQQFRLGVNRVRLKSLTIRDELQVRNRSDTAYAPMVASDYVTRNPSTALYAPTLMSIRNNPPKNKLAIVRETPVYEFKGGGMQRFSALQDYSAPVETTIGFITERAPNEIKKSDGYGVEAVSLSNTIGVLWGAVQELSTQVDSLTERVDQQ